MMKPIQGASVEVHQTTGQIESSEVIDLGAIDLEAIRVPRFWEVRVPRLGPTALMWSLAVPVLLAACGGETSDDQASGEPATIEVIGDARADPGPTTLPGTDEDWGIMQEQARWAYRNGLDTLPIGQIVARIGERFVGTPYAPHTLEVEGEESLVIELQELDCVTFVENVLALARFVRRVPEAMLDDQMGRYRPFYSGILQNIRYRSGILDGYPTRLHYFSEWISDKDAMGLVRNLSAELGGVPDEEPIDFMTTHPDAYRQLGEDPTFLPALREIEARLSSQPRHYVPQDRIAEVADRIQDGDLIAATSTVAGLDIAHTGIALWKDGRLHLLHAPLVDGVVEVSEVPLADRVQRIGGQDGIMVARPLEP
jgi:hypothetical protein